MQFVGNFAGEPVSYDKATDIVYCKGINVFLKHLIKFNESDRVRANLDSEVTISRTETTYKIGCLEDSKVKFNQLIKTAKQL